MSSIDLELCYMSATQAIAKFKAKELSPVELMSAIIARSEQVNNKVNALTHTYYDRALEQAKEAEKKYGKSDGRPRPLEGVPVTIKDLHPIKGEITTYGSKVYENYRPDFTSPTVERLFEAGAIMHQQSTTPEFGHSAVTRSPLWGTTRNPWNTEYSAGGSSGGSAAQLAAGMTTIADGTDGAGSCRIPPSMCGAVGVKPSWGRNPLSPEFPLEEFLHYSPITRSVGDTALVQNVMSGWHPADMACLREDYKLPARFEPIRGWKIALSMDLGYFEVDVEVQENTRKAAEIFRGLGCEVTEIQLGWNFSALEAMTTHWSGLCAALAGKFLPQWREQMDPFFVTMIEQGQRITAADMYRVRQVKADMYKKLQPVLDKYNVLICPTVATSYIRADHQNDDRDFRINGRALPQSWIQPYLTYPFNLQSWCPVISVPSGFSRNGVPTGLQIVGRTFDDLSVFQAAAAFEQVAGPWFDKPDEWPKLG